MEKVNFFNASSGMSTGGGGWLLRNILCVYTKTVPDGGLEEFTPRPDAGWFVWTPFWGGIDAKNLYERSPRIKDFITKSYYQLNSKRATWPEKSIKTYLHLKGSN